MVSEIIYYESMATNVPPGTTTVTRTDTRILQYFKISHLSLKLKCLENKIFASGASTLWGEKRQDT